MMLMALVLKFAMVRAHEVRITVKPSAEARVVDVVLENEDYFRASSFEVSPDRTTYWVEFRDVPSGMYQLEAQEHLSSTKQRNATPLNVMVP